MQVIRVYYDEHGLKDHFVFEKSLRDYILKEKIKKPGEDAEFVKEVIEVMLDYYSYQAREMVLAIGGQNNFDLYILSTAINSGIWARPINDFQELQNDFEKLENLERYFKN